MIREVTRTAGKFLFPLFFILSSGAARAEFAPGDVLREYHYKPASYLRVGGPEGYGGTDLVIEGSVDLAEAVRAELYISKTQCHVHTEGLRVSINNQPWIPVALPPGTPSPYDKYMHMVYPILPVPLSYLKTGENRLRFRVDENSTTWPQNLIYGAVLRVYYKNTKPHPAGTITHPQEGGSIGMDVVFQIDAQSDNSLVKRVEYIGYYEDFGWEGTSLYRTWHYVVLNGNMMKNIGHNTRAPFHRPWQTDRIPDQPGPMQVLARVHDANGMISITPAVKNLALSRPGYAVELCKPYGVPMNWVTRAPNNPGCFFDVTAKPGLTRATKAFLVWTNWCGSYNRGLYLNNNLITDQGIGASYNYAHTRYPVPVSTIKTGRNYVYTKSVPKIDGVHIHGMEVQWPGIGLVIQYDLPEGIDDVSEPDRKPFRVSVSPNPVPEKNNVKIGLPAGESAARIRIMDMTGTVIRSSGPVRAGLASWTWDGADRNGYRLQPGMYHILIRSGNRQAVTTVILQ